MPNKPYQILDLFPIPVLVTTVIPDEEELKYLKTIPDSNLRDNTDGEYDYILKRPQLKKISNTLKTLATEFAQECLSISGKMTYQQSWVNNKTYGTNYHQHKNSIVSGAYYFSGGGDKLFIFDKTPVSGTYLMEPLLDESRADMCKYTKSQVGLQIQENFLVLFPSWMAHAVVPKQLAGYDTYGTPHEVNESPGNQGSIHQSLAFNLVPKNTLGERNSLNQFNYKVIAENIDAPIYSREYRGDSGSSIDKPRMR